MSRVKNVYPVSFALNRTTRQPLLHDCITAPFSGLLLQGQVREAKRDHSIAFLSACVEAKIFIDAFRSATLADVASENTNLEPVE